MSWPIDEEDEGCGTLEDDYYAFLNIFRDASSDDITNAYRRLSKVYHPDKHTDPVKKKDAEILFNKTKRAYEVLIDPHKRAIYDTLGIKGLETDGWEVVQRTKTPQEIREEYEQLSREREERKLQQRTNPKGTVTVGIDATGLFENYDYEEGLFSQLEINSMTISQSIEAPLSINDTVTLHGNIASQNGTGNGNVGCSLRHVISTTTWSEWEIGAGNGLYGSIKGFHRISKRCFGTMHGLLQFTPSGIRPSVTTTLAQQLGKHTIGYLTWKAGRQSSMNTTVVWDSSNGHFVAALQTDDAHRCIRQELLNNPTLLRMLNNMALFQSAFQRLTLGLPNTYAMISYIHRLPDECQVKASAKVGTFGMQVEYGCEIKVTKHSALGASVIAGVPCGVTLKIKINRASQTYIFPLHLSEELLPSAIFYGTVAPLIGWYAVKMLLIKPYMERETKRKAKKAKETNATKLAEKKKEAAAAVSLMHETYTRNREFEENKGGLVIMKALYGKLVDVEREDNSSNKDAEVVDVTIPIQCLVKDSRLILVEASKSNLPGFYDPCLGEDKHLLILYKFRNLQHSITISDLEALRMPKESHLQKS